MHLCAKIVKLCTLNAKKIFFAYLTTIYPFLGIFLLIRYIQKNGILKKVIFSLIKNKMWKKFF